jgi:hypothetical protein
MEVKAGKTINKEYFKNLLYWNELSGMKKGYVAYAGAGHQQRTNGIDVMGLYELCSSDLI